MAATLTHIGKYRIERELGRGGMGIVYKAFDPVVERMVAIKTLRLDVENAAELVQRLRREAKSVGQLEHPNIVTLYDAGESAGLFYLAMQFIQGETLQDRMTRQGWFPLREVLEVFSQICLGLDYAHQHGVIHRDIKPANIMITPEGVVKLTDFGIAKLAGTGVTSTGLVVGTPSYMSPEQALGRVIDGRSDIFSLGSILYEMMTGEKAFAGQNVTTVMYKIVHEAPTPLAALQPGLDPSVEAIVLRALAKNPDQRYQTCGDLATELEVYISRAVNAIPKTSVAAAPAATTVRKPTGATPATPLPTAPPMPTAPITASTDRIPVAAPSTVDEVPLAPVGPSAHVLSATAPTTATQPVARQGVPVAWLGGGVLGTLLLVVVILLIVQMLRQPSQAPAPAEQAAVEGRQPAAQPSSNVAQPSAQKTQPATQPTAEQTQPAPSRASAEPSTSPAPTRRPPSRPTVKEAAVNPLASQPTSPGAGRSASAKAQSSRAVMAAPAAQPASKPTAQATPPAEESGPEPEPSATSVRETYQSVMLKGDLALQQGQYERARALYLRAYRMNPSSRAVRRKLVTVWTLLGKPEEALKYK